MATFRTIEVSDAMYESDHLRFITVKSSYLKGRGDIVVFTPSDNFQGQELPIVILLHGVYGSAWAWAYKAGVHLQTLQMINAGELPPMMLVMPSDGLWGDGSAYLPHDGYDFEKWITEDVIHVVEYLTERNNVSSLFIAGLSMGGFGALHVGVKYHRQFKGIAAHSAITNLEQMKLFVEEELYHYYQQDKSEEDVFETCKKYVGKIPPIRFDCGKDDLLIDYNRQLHIQMQEYEIPHIYEEYKGGHEWNYWTKHIGRSLKFFAALL
jgi:putative tributyrin esterase